MTHPTPHDDLIAPEIQAAVQRAIDSGHLAAPEPDRGRTRQAAFGAALVAAAALTLVIVVVAASPSGGPIDVIARAQAAISERGRLVHYIVTTNSGTARGRGLTATIRRSRCQVPGGTEVWQAANPNRWRASMLTNNKRCRADGTFPIDPVADRWETSWAAGATESYIHRRGRVDRTTGYSARGTAARVPVGIDDVGRGDPLTTLRTLLQDGRLTDRGTRTVNRRQVRTLTGTTTTEGHGYRSENDYTYDVDPNTFEPVRATRITRNDRIGGFKRCTVVCRAVRTPRGTELTFRTYEHRPLNNQTERLLRINPPTGVPVVERTVQEIRRTIRKNENR